MMKKNLIILLVILFSGAAFTETELSVKKKNSKVSMVSTGTIHTCALDDEGVRCWGDNKYAVKLQTYRIEYRRDQKKS